MVAFGSIIPLEQGGRRVFGMSWMPVSGVCIGSRVERAVRDASRTHFHVGTGISWNLETPGVSRKKQRAGANLFSSGTILCCSMYTIKLV